MGFPGGSSGKESSCPFRSRGLDLGLGTSSGGGNGIPTSVSREESHGHGSLAGCSHCP